MRPTIRGWAVIGVCVLGLTLGWTFGPRALNAIVAPLLVALLVGVVQVRRAEPPSIEDEAIRPGFPGEARTRRLQVDGGGVATVATRLQDALGGAATVRTGPLPTSLEQPLQLERRGVHDLGTVTVTQRDPLGLVASRTTLSTDETVVVYPTVYSFRGDHRLESLFGDQRASERGAFDRLREYVPGDPLRNINWKASAKHDEYIVTEFAPTSRRTTLTVAAESTDGGTDEMASAVASIVDRATADGVPVELRLPGPAGPRRREVSALGAALGLLAAVEPGTLPARLHETADVSIDGRPEGTTVRIGERAASFRSLAGDSEPRRRSPEVVA